jgi:hypothetical protein
MSLSQDLINGSADYVNLLIKEENISMLIHFHASILFSRAMSGVHKIALLHEIAFPSKILTPSRRPDILFLGKQNAEMKS